MENGSSISKVTVEYYDPSGVFPLISRQLQSHFPLRDLHWKSPTRPLRSIDSLHVDLVAARDSDRPGSRHGTPGLDHGSPARAPGEHRHQIPGLRQTPYLKVYLLRCDDSEAYKSTARKSLREWLKTHTPASQSSSSRSSQENHDAFEWLILHVVLPNTGAAGQPRVSGSSSKSENVASEKSGTSSKLLGRSASTILEKIKADFNVSSKSAPDRVAQLRLHADELAPDKVPPTIPASVQDYQESPQEHITAGQDIINKFKILILLSFSLRVSQYEDDIRERDAQRALPGWNFCTFFMLKEGLTRGFESVGLVDDALIGYDELSLGLENAMNEGGDGGDLTTRSDSFLKYTKEMKDILLQCLTSDSTPEAFWKSGTNIVSTARKDYRNLIVNSNVSLFDFQCYIFARQMSILLRMGISPESPKGHAANQQNQANSAQTDDVAPFSDLCQRAATFISIASRTLRSELLQAAVTQGIKVPMLLVENITASFAFAVAEQVLEATDIPALSRAQIPSNTPDLHQTMDRLQHPVRKSSLQPRTPPPQQASDNPIAMLKRIEDTLATQPGEDEFRIVPVTELGILAGHRADLLLLQRRVAERLAEQKNWKLGLSRLHAAVSSYNDVDLGNEHNEPSDEENNTPGLTSANTDHNGRGVLYSTLIDALASLEDFEACYEKLTNLALSQCALALRAKSVERLVADLAVVKFDKGDPTTAASYLGRVIPSFADHNWSLIETELVKMHAQCLRKLNRKDDYVRMALSILSKAAARKKASLELRVDARPRPSKGWLDDENTDSQDILDDLLSVSEELPCDVLTSMNDFFLDISIDPYITHFNDKDGFALDLKLRYLLTKTLTIGTVKIKLKSIDPPFREFWLESLGSSTLKVGINSIQLESQTTCSGSFSVEKLVIKSHKISFETELKRLPALGIANQPTQPSSDEASILNRLPHIYCYTANEALSLGIKVSNDIYIDKTRVMEIEIQTGRNTILKGQLSLKAASAGLRLVTAEATVTDDEVALTKGKAPGLFEIADLASQSAVTILVPYDMESNLPQITVGLSFTYTTSTGTFQYFSDPTIPIDLALDVSVHDLFRTNLLYSRFQIRASRGIPLLIRSVELEESDRYAVQAPPCKLTPMLVLPRQDGTVLYKITPKEGGNLKRQSIKEEKPLQLNVTYMPFNEVIFAAVEESLLGALADSGFESHTRALKQAFSQPFQYLSQEKLEEAALLNEFHLPSYENMGWNELLDGLAPQLRQELGSFLKTWHTKNGIIPLLSSLAVVDDTSSAHSLHSIKISVPLPRLHLLHTTSLSLFTTATFISQGSVVPATISVSHTRRWDSPSAIASLTSSAADDPIDFYIEIDSPPDTWLIGGQKRSRFSAVEGEEKTFKLMLVPLKTGRLLLPEIIVRLTGKAPEELTCETDYKNLGKMVVVVADIKSTTVGLNELANGTEIVVMSNEQRA